VAFHGRVEDCCREVESHTTHHHPLCVTLLRQAWQCFAFYTLVFGLLTVAGRQTSAGQMLMGGEPLDDLQLFTLTAVPRPLSGSDVPHKRGDLVRRPDLNNHVRAIKARLTSVRNSGVRCQDKWSQVHRILWSPAPVVPPYTASVVSFTVRLGLRIPLKKPNMPG
jgi:hypothetical protein